MNKTDILELFDSRHHIKAEILKDMFKKTDLYKQILLETKCYNIFNNLSLRDRLLILRYNIKIKYCNKCKSPYINIDKKHITTCICFKKYKVNQNSKKYDIHNEINDLIYFINKNKNFNVNHIMKRYQRLITNIVNQTKDIVPFNSINDLNLVQRLYHIFYNIHEYPKCNYCLNKLTFKNFDNGYLPCQCNNVNHVSLPDNLEILNYLKNTKYTWLNKNTFNNLHDMPIKLLCTNCMNEFNYTFTEFKHNHELNINCNICNPLPKITQQTRINNFIKSLSLQTIENYNPELGKAGSYECDIFIPKLNIGIEYNGLYWHSTNKLASKDYHLNKLEYYNKFNIRLITIFEDEWLEHEQQIKEKLIAILNKSKNKIYAKNCIIKPISNSLKNKFIKTNSFNIIDKSKIKLGIFNNNYMIGVMTFNILNNGNNWELINYITNTHVIRWCRQITKIF